METPAPDHIAEQSAPDRRASPLAAGVGVLLAAGRVGFGAAMTVLRAAGKAAITVWRLAAALDSALWRAVKLLAVRALEGLGHAAGLAAGAFRGLLLWLPTRTGRAYSALSGAFLVIAGLWIVDVLRSAPALDAAGAASARAPVDEDDPILARIDGRYVHLSEIEATARAGGFLRPDETLTPKTAFERNLVEAYVEQRLLARAATDEGLQRSPIVARRVNAARDRVLAAAYMDERIKSAVTPEAVERLYKSQADITRLGDEVRARHILVATGKEAEDIIALLKAGGDFAELARMRSLDRATAPLGGEVGWFTQSMMTPDFARAAFAAKPGEIAPPFQTEFGWHILEVLDRRPTSAVPFAQVQAPIEDFLRMRTIENSLRELEEKSQVVYFRPEEEKKQQLVAPPDLSDPALTDPGFSLPAVRPGPPQGEEPPENGGPKGAIQ